MIQTVWSGGVTRDGVTPIALPRPRCPGCSTSTALPRLLIVWLADGRALDDDAENFTFLGLADLGGDTRLYPKKGLNFPCRRTRVKVNLAAGSAGKAACLMPDPLGAQPPAEGRSGRSR